jgi:hypothetical protein
MIPVLVRSLHPQADEPGPPGVLSPEQMLVAILLATVMLLVVIELVRKRKLREEYAFLWIGTAILLMVLALWTDVLEWIRVLLRAQTQASPLFFGAILFLMLVALQFSVRLTKLTFRNKALGQEVSLLRKEVQDLRDELDAGAGRPSDPEAMDNIEIPRERDPKVQASEQGSPRERPSRQ